MISRPGSPITESDIAQFEQVQNFSLPIGYRKFLKCHNGGTPVPGTFKYLQHGKTLESDVAHFYSVAELKVLEKNSNRLLEIANDFFGNRVLLRVQGPKRGEIVFWEFKYELTDDSLCHIATDFDSFFNSLYEISSPPEAFEFPETLFIKNDLEGIQRYINSCVDLNAPTECGLGLTLLAIKWQRYQVLDVLLRAGASTHEAMASAVRGDDIDAVRRILKSGVSANEGSHNEPPIVRAAANRSRDIVKLLLENNADVHALDWRNRSALRWAIINKDSVLIELLKASGAVE